MLVKTLLPFVLAALAANARPVLPIENAPADVKDAVLAAPGGHGHGIPFEDVHPPTGQRRDVPEPPAKPEGVNNTHVDQAIPFGQAPVPHDRMPKKAPLPASPPSTPADSVAPQVASRGFVTKPAVLDEVDPMSERNSALGTAQSAQAEDVPAGTRDAKTPVPAPAPDAPTPGSAPDAPAAPAPPAPAKDVEGVADNKVHANDDSDDDSDDETNDESDSESSSDPNSKSGKVVIRVGGRRSMEVSKPATPVTDALPVKEDKLPVRDEAPKVPSAVTDKSQMVSSTFPHAVPRQVEAPEVKHRPSPNPQDVPSVSPKEETPTVTAPPEEQPTVPAPASEVQPTTVTSSQVSDVPSAPTNDAQSP
jgi:hypothetical protein